MENNQEDKEAGIATLEDDSNDSNHTVLTALCKSNKTKYFRLRRLDERELRRKLRRELRES